MEKAGFRFSVDAANIHENMQRTLPPRDLVMRLALEKASAVAVRHANAVVIGADTIVALGKKVWSKPENKAEARMILRTLSGKGHDVWTGYCIIDTKSGKRKIGAVATRVVVRKLTDKEIDWYVSLGEPMEGAGGYKMQGSGHALIARIEGDYNNVIGFPLATLLKELKKFGVEP